MTGFFRGPGITTHVLCLALICAISLPLLHDAGLTGRQLILAGLSIILVYTAIALVWACRHIIFRKTD